ncbi:MATE family efflux transporter [Loigolactobacillus binensis]
MRTLTDGRPLKLILWFTLPLLIGNFFQQFYNIADTLIVGQTLGVKALAAVGATGGLSFLIIGFAQGMTTGLSLLTAQRFGAQDFRGVRRSFGVSIVISLVVALVLTVISVTFTRPFLVLMATPNTILPQAVAFIRIIFAGICASMLFNLFSNMLRALGDSRTPLIFLVIASVINIILDFVLIIGFHLGVAGAGYATVTAQIIAGLLCLVYIYRHIPYLQVQWRDFKWDKKIYWQHLRMGLPLGFQSSVIAIGAIILQVALNDLGTNAVAASTAASKIDQIATLPMMSLGITLGTYAAQNYGAQAYGRIIKGVRQSLFLSVGFSLVLSVAIILSGRWLVTLFIGHDSAVLDLAQTYFLVMASGYVFLDILFVMRYTLQGLGYSLIAIIAGFAELLMRALAVFVLVKPFGYAGAAASEPLAWIGSCIVLVITYLRAIRHLRQAEQLRQKANGPAAQPVLAGPELKLVEELE